MHREMGMNVIRLWGGNGGAARGLWDAADEQGVLVFQEFWQSGVRHLALRSSCVVLFRIGIVKSGYMSSTLFPRTTMGAGLGRSRGPSITKDTC